MERSETLSEPFDNCTANEYKQKGTKKMAASLST